MLSIASCFRRPAQFCFALITSNWSYQIIPCLINPFALAQVEFSTTFGIIDLAELHRRELTFSFIIQTIKKISYLDGFPNLYSVKE